MIIFRALLLILVFSPQLSRAYSQFIGYGYTSCLTCHYNAGGNGPLNDYGRMLAATEIADRVLGPSDPEALANQSGFLGSVQLPWWWRPSIDYRGLNLQRSIGQNVPARYIHMQADFSNVLRFDENDRIVAVANFGYAPTPRNVSRNIPEAHKNWISREHYLRVEATENLRIYAGLMDKVYGIRTPDHEAFARRYTYNAMNDQVHGIMINYNHLPIELNLHGFMGNLQQEEDLRHKGGSFTLELEPKEMMRLGVTGQMIRNEYMEMTAGALMAKSAIGKGSSILFETGVIGLKPIRQESRTGFYAFLQPYLKLRRGLHFFMTNEYYTENVIEERTRLLRWGPGFQYFPAQRFEFRLDVWNERSFVPESVRKEDWSVLSQVHVWL